MKEPISKLKLLKKEPIRIPCMISEIIENSLKYFYTKQ